MQFAADGTPAIPSIRLTDADLPISALSFCDLRSSKNNAPDDTEGQATSAGAEAKLRSVALASSLSIGNNGMAGTRSSMRSARSWAM